MANTKEKKLTKYEQNAARRNARPLAILALLKPLNLPFIRVINSGNSNSLHKTLSKSMGSQFKLRTKQTLQIRLERQQKRCAESDYRPTAYVAVSEYISYTSKSQPVGG